MSTAARSAQREGVPVRPASSTADRVEQLLARYRDIAATRMQGLPVLHPGLAVAAVGFQAEPTEDQALPAAIGVLLTPWFMNLVWLPLARLQRPDRLGQSSTRLVGAHAFAFIGMHDEALGSYAACSLFSPVHEFADQAAALATAHSVLAQLRPPAPAPAPVAVAPARRRFLLGRGAAHA